MKIIKKQLSVIMAIVFLVTGITFNGVDVQAAVKINKKSISIKVGKTYKLKVKGTKKKVKWSSSNKKVATVSAKGVVKGKKKGKAVITAQVRYKKKVKKLKCKVTVKKQKKSSATSPTQPAVSKLPVSFQPAVTPAPIISKTPDPDDGPVDNKPKQKIPNDVSFPILEIRYGDQEILFTQENGLIIVEKGDESSLKEKYPDADKISMDVVDVCSPDGNTVKNAQVSDIVWHEESFYSSSEDQGYYSIRVEIPHQEEILYYDYFIVEPVKRPPSKWTTVSGILQCADGKLISNSRLCFETEQGGYFSYIDTDENGNYKAQLKKETTYSVYYIDEENPKMKLATIELDQSSSDQMVKDLKADFVYEISGTMRRFSEIWGGAEISIYRAEGGISYANMKTNIDTGEYQCFLSVGEYNVSVEGVHVKEFEVKEEHMTLDIDADLCKISGIMHLNSDTVLENGIIEVGVEFSEMSYRWIIVTDEKGYYETYVNTNTSCTFRTDSSYLFDTVEIGNEHNLEHNMTIGACYVSGTLMTEQGEIVREQWIWFKEGEQTLCVCTDRNGTYHLIVPIGEYMVSFGTDKEWAFSVTPERTDYDLKIPLFKLSGKLSNFSIPWNRKMPFTIGCKDENDGHISTNLNEDGTYYVYLPEGTYQVGAMWITYEDEEGVNHSTSIKNPISSETVVISADCVRDFDFSYYHLSGSLDINTDTWELYDPQCNYLEIYDPNGKVMGEIWITNNLKDAYGACLEQLGQYSIKYNGKEVDSFILAGSMTRHNICLS